MIVKVSLARAERLPERPRVGAERLGPEPVADEGNRLGSDAVIGRREHASELRLNPENVEEAGRDEAAVQPLRGLSLEHGEGRALVGGHRLE